MEETTFETPQPQDWRFAAMYAELVRWGLCWLRAGGGRTSRFDIVQVLAGDAKEDPAKLRIVASDYVDPPDPADDRPIQWTKPEIERAGRLHSRVIRLPLQHRLVLQVYFNETVARFFDDLMPDKQAAVVRDLTHWRGEPLGVNARIARFNRTTGAHERGIRTDEFIPIRDRGIRMLANQERFL